jgi:hypothetical protein
MGAYPQEHLICAVRTVHATDRSHVRSAPFEITITTTGPRRRRTDDAVTGHVSGKLLLGHAAPAAGGYGAASRIDRRVTRKAPKGPRIDGSGRSEAPPATSYRVFTADRNIAREGQRAVGRRPLSLWRIYLQVGAHLSGGSRPRKGKPVARRGRKAYGPLQEVAGLPKGALDGTG